MTHAQMSEAGTRMSNVLDRLDRAQSVAKDARRQALENGFSEVVAETMGVGAFQLMLTTDAIAEPCSHARCQAKRKRRRRERKYLLFAGLFAVHFLVLQAMAYFVSDQWATVFGLASGVFLNGAVITLLMWWKS